MTITYSERLLSAAEECVLARQIEAGVLASGLLDNPHRGAGSGTDAELADLVAAGEQAWGRFIAANLRLVSMVANPIAARRGLDADELFQEGVLGLMEALQRYDYRRSARFATFALPWIRMRVHESAVTRCGEIWLSPARARSRRRVIAAQQALAGPTGEPVTIGQIAERVGHGELWVRERLAYTQPLSLDADDGLPEPQVLAESVASSGLDPMGVQRLLSLLRPEELAVVERRFGFGAHPPMPLMAIADELGLSLSTVRRREQAALARLRRCEELSPAA